MTASLCTPPPSSPRHARGVAWLLAGMAALGPPSRAAADAPRRYALIIGSNRTADPERPALAFAEAQGDQLFSVWSFGPSDAWAVGAGGTAIHRDGSAWTSFPSGTSQALHAVAGIHHRLS